MKEFVYRDQGKFRGLVQINSIEENPRAWKLRAETEQANLYLKAVGVSAVVALMNDETKNTVEQIGWTPEMIKSLAEGKEIDFDGQDPFTALVGLMKAISVGDEGLEMMFGVFGWRQ